MDSHKVTVLMSVYNGKKYLREAIDSILNQTFNEFEFLIINDGSTDRTDEILRSYDDHRIKIIKNETNIGLTKSLNIGLRMAKGEYVARMDADDVSMPERLEKEVNFLDQNRNVGLVGSFALQIDEDGNILRILERSVNNSAIKRGLLEKYNQFWHGSVMFRKECIERVGNYREEFQAAQDYDLWLRIADQYEVANIPEGLYKMRFHPDTITVLRRVKQGRYVELAKKLAKERRNFGKDSLQYGDRSKTAEILSDISSGSRIEKRKELAYGYYKWANSLFHWNRLEDCRGFSVKVLLRDPLNFGAWRLLVLSSLPPNIIKVIRKIKRVFYV